MKARARTTVRDSHSSRLVVIVLMLASSAPAWCQAAAPAPTVVEPVARQLIHAWAKALVENDLASLQIYYADPRAVTPWKEWLNETRVQQANLLAVHSIQSASDRAWGGSPLCGEVRFTIEFWVTGLSYPFNETRDWSLTNQNGYLQIAYERREKEPVLPPRHVERLGFPQLGGDPASYVSVVEPLPQPTAAPRMEEMRPTPGPVATPTLNEGPIAKEELIDQIWNTLLLRFKKAYEYRSESLFKKCFVKEPDEALEEFRDKIGGRGWMQVDRLEIDADSVQGNNLNCTFRFRYSLWGAGLKRDDFIEVECAAIRGGPGWRFSRFGGEEIAPPARPPGYYPPEGFVTPLVSPPPPSPWQRIFGRR